jgi:hypothetical protein
VVDVLVILDGASEPLRDGGGPRTSLELARTPVLDRLASEGELTRVRTVAPWLSAGSEAAIPALLGWTPPSAVDRGAVEAAAHGIDVGIGERAWRVDVVAGARGGFVAPGATHSPHTSDSLRPRQVDGACGAAPVGRSDDPLAARATGRSTRREVALAVAVLRFGAPAHAVREIGGHRLLLVGRAPLPAAARAPGLRAWPEGIVPPAILGEETVVVGARGAAIGIARLMGAATVVPAGATGLPGSDLAAKAAAALDAIAAGAARVVVHVGGPDEAAHLCDRAAKVATIEHADRDLLAPLHAAVRAAGGTLRVCPDHGCDPSTGEHDAAPVPCVRWSADGVRRDVAGEPHGEVTRGAAPGDERRLTERAVAQLPAVDLPGASRTLVAA